MMRYKGKYICTIGDEVSKKPAVAHGIRQAIGRILPQDKGKQVYEVAARVYQVENDEQLKSRLQ